MAVHRCGSFRNPLAPQLICGDCVGLAEAEAGGQQGAQRLLGLLPPLAPPGEFLSSLATSLHRPYLWFSAHFLFRAHHLQSIPSWGHQAEDHRSSSTKADTRPWRVPVPASPWLRALVGRGQEVSLSVRMLLSPVLWKHGPSPCGSVKNQRDLVVSR